MKLTEAFEIHEEANKVIEAIGRAYTVATDYKLGNLEAWGVLGSGEIYADFSYSYRGDAVEISIHFPEDFNGLSPEQFFKNQLEEKQAKQKALKEKLEKEQGQEEELREYALWKRLNAKFGGLDKN